VVFRNGASPTQRGDAAGARKRATFGKRAPSSRSPSRNQYAVCDGRTALGIVKLSDGIFTSVTAAGTVVGTFSTLREASRALPDEGAS
jgi:hypothetical protein